MKRILFVGMVNSPHFARWINQLANEDYEIHIFSVYFATPHHLLKNVTVHLPWFKIRPRKMLRKLFRGRLSTEHFFEASNSSDVNSLRIKSIWPIPLISPLDTKISSILWSRLGNTNCWAPFLYGPRTLSKLIKKIKPDLIHSMEFQHAGYLVLEAKKNFSGKLFPKWLATNWGSDIYYFRNFDLHKKQITKLLSEIDFYSCECERDITIAKELGLTAKVLPVIPNSGGFDLASIKPLRSRFRTSSRKLLMVKGYQHFVGRAMIALDAIAACANLLSDYQIIIYAASPEVRERAKKISEHFGINIKILEHTSHQHMMEYFARARIYLGVSISDGISTSMIEAMAMGAFPMQTNTACCSEWIQDGVTGFELEHTDLESIIEKLKLALTDDILVDEASNLNWVTVEERLDIKKTQSIAKDMYKTVFKG